MFVLLTRVGIALAVVATCVQLFSEPPTVREEVLTSGVRIEHQAIGNGRTPKANSRVVLRYRGTVVATGVEFDSTYSRGKAAVVDLGRAIPCWNEALQHLAVGGKAVVVCPASTAYGARGAGEAPPNSDLRFYVELMNVL